MKQASNQPIFGSQVITCTWVHEIHKINQVWRILVVEVCRESLSNVYQFNSLIRISMKMWLALYLYNLE